MNVPRIIGISGKYGSGKDSLANFLIKTLSNDKNKIKHIKFADKVKQITSILSGTSIEDNYSDEGKSKIIPFLDYTIGRFQQILGTSMREYIHPDIWTLSVFEEIKNNPDTIFIISDCRFKNEANMIHKHGGIIIRLERKAENISAKSSSGRDPNHISETDLDDYKNFDFIIDNNFDIKDMYKQAEVLLK